MSLNYTGKFMYVISDNMPTRQRSYKLIFFQRKIYEVGKCNIFIEHSVNSICCCRTFHNYIQTAQKKEED